MRHFCDANHYKYARTLYLSTHHILLLRSVRAVHTDDESCGSWRRLSDVFGGNGAMCGAIGTSSKLASGVHCNLHGTAHSLGGRALDSSAIRLV